MDKVRQVHILRRPSTLASEWGMRIDSAQMTKPRVALIGTGGTISSIGRDSLDLWEYMDTGLKAEPDAPEQIIVDRVLRYEQLNEELAAVFARFAIPFAGALGVKAKSEYRTDRRPYRDVYTQAQGERVGEVFVHERRLHGYLF